MQLIQRENPAEHVVQRSFGGAPALWGTERTRGSSGVGVSGTIASTIGRVSHGQLRWDWGDEKSEKASSPKAQMDRPHFSVWIDLAIRAIIASFSPFLKVSAISSSERPSTRHRRQ
jgi:hypothetical protein